MKKDNIVKRFLSLMQTPAGVLATNQTKHVLKYFGLRWILPLVVIGIGFLVMGYYSLFLLLFPVSMLLAMPLTTHYASVYLK